MKRCPECRRDYYDDTLLYCLDDGNALLEGPASADEPATAQMPSIGLSGEAPTRSFEPSEITSDTQNRSIDPTQRSTSKDRRTTLPIIAGIAILAIGGIGFAVYKFWGRSEKPPPAMKFERLTTNGKSVDAAISPDGKYVVYILNEGGQQSLWTRQIATTSNVQIIPSADVQYSGLVFSPDSNYINFVKREKSDVSLALYQMPVLGGAQKKLITGANGTVGYSPDGKQFAFVRERFPTTNEGSLLIANADGTGERILASLKRPEEFAPGEGRRPSWSPDGKTIVCVAISGGNSKVVEVQVADGAVKPIAGPGWNGITQIAWLPDKSGLLILGVEKFSACNPQIWRVSYPGGEARRITTDVNDYVGMSVTADANAIAAVKSDRLSNIWVAPNGDATRAVQIKSGGSNLDGINGLRWTPDGRIIYYSIASGTPDIWIMNADGSGQKQLTVEAGANSMPTVTPDGRYIVFRSTRSGGLNIWRMDLDGGNARQLTTGNIDLGPTVSPDSQWVIYTSRSSGNPILMKVSIEGGRVAELTENPSYAAEISPDGELIACRYHEDISLPGRGAIIPFAGGKPIKIFDLPGSTESVRWARDSRSLTYSAPRGGVSNIWSFPLDGTAPKQLTNFKTEQIYNFDWSADGKQLVLARGTTTSDVVLIKDFR